MTGGRPQRLSRSELKQLDEKELIFELVRHVFYVKIQKIKDKLNYFAWQQVKDICNDLDVRSLCHKILQNVSILLNADRGSLFLVQKRSSTSINDPVK